MNLKDKKIILKSTNGTVSFFKLVEAEYVFAMSLLNLKYSTKVISDMAAEKNKDIFLVCSGTEGKITYEDAYTAGMAIQYLMKLTDLKLSDSARIALDIVTVSYTHLDVYKRQLSARKNFHFFVNIIIFK